MGKGRSKKRSANKRRRQKTERRRLRQAAIRQRLPISKRIPQKALQGFSEWPEDEHVFWVCHGANCLSSDYEGAVWSPLFPDLYDGQTYSGEAIAKAVMRRYGNVGKEGEGYSEGKALIAWAVQDKEAHYSYRHLALEAVKKAHKGADNGEVEELLRKPYQSEVWEVFNQLKTLLQQRTP